MSVHSGHGFPNYLAFEDENNIGETRMVSKGELKKMVISKNGIGQQLQLVFTSACHSEHVGRAFVKVGVPHVVSIDNQFAVSDEGAMRFTRFFYDALLCGNTVSESFETAKLSVQTASSSAKRDSEKFLLLGNGLLIFLYFGESKKFERFSRSFCVSSDSRCF